MKKALLTMVAIIISLAPASVFAQDTGWLDSVSSGLGNIFSTAVPVLLSIAVLVFVWGLVVFIKNSGDEKALAEGKQKMVWGIIALFVIVSVWGLVFLLQNITGITPETIVAPRSTQPALRVGTVELGEFAPLP